MDRYMDGQIERYIDNKSKEERERDGREREREGGDG